MTKKSTAITSAERANHLISQMTLEEKVSQLIHDSAAIERLGIKKYNWWNECLHGVARAGVATVFPQAIGMAATWNQNLIGQVAEVISDEARAKHHAFDREGKNEIYQGLTYWSPNINIFRDPRWGRGMETYGEDPYLTSTLAVAFIKGLQGNDPTYLKLIATPKHFAVHSGPENSRHIFNAQPSMRDLWETYLPAFEACIKDGNAYSVMGAYNRLFGDACTASTLLLQDILRNKWGFKGYVVSDAGAITDIYEHHKIAGSLAEAAALAVKSGTDLCAGTEYLHLMEAAESGFITEAEINVALQRLLTAKIKLGMLDDISEVAYANIPYAVVDCDAHKKLALQTALESMVLLKNDNAILPLSSSLKTIAVIGPNGNETDILLGNYHGTPSSIVSLFIGIKNRAGKNTKVIFERGCALAEGLPFFDVLPAEVLFSDKQYLQHGLKLEYFDNLNFIGTAMRTEFIPCLNRKLFDTLFYKLNKVSNFGIIISGYIKVDVAGRYAIGVAGLTSFQLFIDNILLTSFNTIWEPEKVYEYIDMKAGVGYFIELKINAATSEAHTQKLVWAVPDPKMEDRALAAAAQADVVILAMGLSPQLEGEEMPVKVEGFNHGDRSNLDLPQAQEVLIKKIAALGKPIVLTLFNGCALSINWAAKNIPAILETWYGGQAAGDAIAAVLFGDYNPSGRLPVTFYQSVNQLPAFDDYAMEGRTYRYFKGKTLFSFGHGLSYTKFEYSNFQIPTLALADESFIASVDVQNNGKIDGDEIVQLYISRMGVAGNYPLRSLQGFKKIHLKAMETQTVLFKLSSENFAVIQDDMQRKVVPGLFEISIGGCQPSADAIQHNNVIIYIVER